MPAFGPASIQGMFTEMHEIASQLALKWARHGSDAPIMVTDDFTRLTLDTLALCTMNFRFNSYYHDELHPFINAMGDFLTESGARAMRPSLTAFLYPHAARKYWDDIEILRQTAQGVLDTRRKDAAGRKDLLSVMLSGVDPKTGQKLSDSSIIDNLITFLIAGHETTSGLLSFTFYLLIKHRDAYRKAQAEVDSVIGKGPIKVEHINKVSVATPKHAAGRDQAANLHCLDSSLTSPPFCASHCASAPRSPSSPARPRRTVWLEASTLLQRTRGLLFFWPSLTWTPLFMGRMRGSLCQNACWTRTSSA
jgi:hypothetical protein